VCTAVKVAIGADSRKPRSPRHGASRPHYAKAERNAGLVAALVLSTYQLRALANPQHGLARIFAVEQLLGDFVDFSPGRLDLDLWHKQLLLDQAQQHG